MSTQTPTKELSRVHLTPTLHCQMKTMRTIYADTLRNDLTEKFTFERDTVLKYLHKQCHARRKTVYFKFHSKYQYQPHHKKTSFMQINNKTT